MRVDPVGEKTLFIQDTHALLDAVGIFLQILMTTEVTLRLNSFWSARNMEATRRRNMLYRLLKEDRRQAFWLAG